MNRWRWIACAAGLAAGCGGDDVTADAVPVRVMTYNVGNPNSDEPNYALRLKDQEYEDFMAAKIQALGPDIVVLQELLTPTRCAMFEETDPAYTCYDAAHREPPVRRLLGDGYTIVCDARLHVECVGVRTDFATIAGFAPGSFSLDGAETPPLPMPECDWAAGDCDNTTCDGEADVAAVTVETDFGALRVVHVHPNAAGTTAGGEVYSGAPCRELQLQQAFEGLPADGGGPLVADGPTLVAGDFNMDPIRFASDAEMALWMRNVGPGQRFTDLNPVDENGDQYATRREAFGLAIDHVVSDVATGSCTVHGEDYIGTETGVLALDDDFDWSSYPGGEFYVNRIDHFAVVCDLELDLREAPQP